MMETRPHRTILSLGLLLIYESTQSMIDVVIRLLPMQIKLSRLLKTVIKVAVFGRLLELSIRICKLGHIYICSRFKNIESSFT